MGSGIGRGRLRLLVLAGLVAAWGGPRPAGAQDGVKDYRKPILVVETGGHHARVRSMLWQDGATLLSGGEDKVVKVWDLREGPAPVRTIRPPIWRGPAGTIYAMALSRPDAQGRSYLAVGGYGVESRRGDLTIFRLPALASAPGIDGRIPTGDVVARLLSQPANQAQATGHTNSVFCLAFDPAGRSLASGGRDGTVILWDVPAFRPRATLRGHTRDIRSLAFSPDGSRLASTGGDGTVHIWDVATAARLDLSPANVQPVPVNTLAFSPDGRSIVVGRENGDLYAFDARNLAAIPPVKLPTLDTQGPVEVLAFAPDGRSMAVSIKSDRADVIDPIALSCDVEMRAWPGGDVIRRWTVPGLVHALAFSPDGSRLAYAGGPGQAIAIREPGNLELPPRELKGEGSTPFNLGFTEDSQAVGFTRALSPPGAPPAYEAFDLGRRKARTIAPDQLRGAIRGLGGWTLEGSLREYRLEAVNQDGRRWRFDLDPDTERNWWSATMIPTGPGHPRATVAVGCESGVLVYDLETGRRTRVFAGHSSPVVSLAPSPDGRWLASGSIDQTILLYPLAGCDRRPGLGATFRQRPDGNWRVQAIEPGSFAAGMGLLPGDRILRAGIARGQTPPRFFADPAALGEFTRLVDDLPPFKDEIAIWVERTLFLPPPLGFALTAPMPPMPSTRRNNAALALMLGMEHEWIIWTPQGYYDTSIDGDSRYLGWHINADYRAPRPTDYFPIGTYARTMLQPGVIDRLWRTGELAQALGGVQVPPGTPAPEGEAAGDQPPRILFGAAAGGGELPAPGTVWTVRTDRPRIGLTIIGRGPSPVARRRVILDGRPLDLPPLAAAAARVSEEFPLVLSPGRRTRLAVQAFNQNGKERTETIDLLYEQPAGRTPTVSSTEAEAAAPAPRLMVVGIGVEQSKNPTLLPPIPFADRDAQDLSTFLSEHVLAPGGVKTRQDAAEDRIVLGGEQASSKGVTRALDTLERRLHSNGLRKGDIILLVLAAHVLEFEKSAQVATADADPGRKPAPAPTIAARDISDLLGRLADYGCRVVLFLDGVHELPDDGPRSNIKPWVRELQRQRRVITFVASKEGPSGVDATKEHGIFAQGILNVFQAGGATGARTNNTAAFSLDQFRRALRQEVLDLSGRVQEADAYFPPDVDPRTTFARP